MPISFDDLRVTRNTRSKQRRIAPLLLETAAEKDIVADFCNYFADLAKHGKRQRDFSENTLVQRAGGDFKLARGLVSALLGVYVWESESFSDYLPTDECERLAEMGITNSSTLRLAMYDYVNTPPRDGYVSAKNRAEAVELFAAGLGLEPDLTETLFWLDNEENAVLRLRTRRDGQPFRSPTVLEIVRRYNRLAVETLLFNSSEVVFTFGALLPGTLVKRIGYYCKELHIPYDLDYNAMGEIQLRLYGPAQAFGSPAKHGEKLSRLTFLALKIARETPQSEIAEAAANYAGPQTTVTDAPKKRGKAPVRAAVSEDMIRSALAVVHLKDKQYMFDVGAFAHFLAPDPEAAEIRETSANYNVANDFDSSVETRFYEQFSALAREGQTAGWQVEREPDALALPAQNLLFVPDFALQRGETRVWLEIVGFWTPDYRIRKLEKLEKLKRNGNHKLVLAIANELRRDFTENEHGEKRDLPFPAIFYKTNLRPTDILALLQKEYDDRAGRLSNVGGVKGEIEDALFTRGYLPESELYRRLWVYSKTELTEALRKLGASGVHLDGYGLCSQIYLDAIKMTVEDALAVVPGLSLEATANALRSANLEADTERLEILLAGVPGLKIARPSIFEVWVQRADTVIEFAPAVVAPRKRAARKGVA
jgi:predicted nuclease of restriction endonuclease-like RecB superfamily